MNQAAVLVVEDDDDIRHSTTELLKAAGYRGLEAANGREALAKLSELAQPCVVILDIMMPVMDGLEFMEELAKTDRLRQLNILILTASPILCVGRAVTAGVPVLPKPCSAARLLELVHERLSPPLTPAS